jgi:hypothetical protein
MSKKKKRDLITGDFAGLVIQYMCQAGSLRDNKHQTWSTITPTVSFIKAAFPGTVQLDFVSEKDPESYFDTTTDVHIAHLLFPLAMCGPILSLLQGNDQITVSFTIESDGQTINAFMVQGTRVNRPPVKPSKSKK